LDVEVFAEPINRAASNRQWQRQHPRRPAEAHRHLLAVEHLPTASVDLDRLPSLVCETDVDPLPRSAHTGEHVSLWPIDAGLLFNKTKRLLQGFGARRRSFSLVIGTDKPLP